MSEDKIDNAYRDYEQEMKDRGEILKKGFIDIEPIRPLHRNKPNVDLDKSGQDPKPEPKPKPEPEPKPKPKPKPKRDDPNLSLF